jgi:hypothetical protein
MGTEFIIYLLVGMFAILYLNSNFSISFFNNPINANDNLLIIEHLTKYATKSKNYRNPPENFKSHGYRIVGNIVGEEVHFNYVFPLLENAESKFFVQLNSQNVSSVVSTFGTSIKCFGPRDKDTYELKSDSFEFLKSEMNKDGFYFHSSSQFGIDYNHVITISKDLSTQIAYFIVQELQAKNRDNYLNRVKATLNFVQFIPYGVPDFDHQEDTYFGLALPHESIGISYSDCDSKSVLFAGILHHMIPKENIIMVSCIIEEGGHMIVGVSDLPFNGQTLEHSGKNYLLLETTVPIPMEHQPVNKFKELKVIPIIQV